MQKAQQFIIAYSRDVHTYLLPSPLPRRPPARPTFVLPRDIHPLFDPVRSCLSLRDPPHSPEKSCIRLCIKVRINQFKLTRTEPN